MYNLRTKSVLTLQKCCRNFAASSTNVILPQKKEDKAKFDFDTKKLTEYCCVNYLKEGENPKLQPDSEYPDWLSEFKWEKYDIHDMSFETHGWKYWQVRSREWADEKDKYQKLMSNNWWIQKGVKGKKFKINPFHREIYKHTKHNVLQGKIPLDKRFRSDYS